MKETEKVDQTIRAISDEIQARINAGDTDSAAKLTKALATLITAKAMPKNIVNNYNISSDK